MVRFINCESKERKDIFKQGDPSDIDKYEGLDSMIIEEKESGIARRSKKRKVEGLRLQTTVSFKKVLLHENSSDLEENANDSSNKVYPEVALPKPEIRISPRTTSEHNAAAIKVQKVYKSYRTRRNLADCAVVVEELWWKAIDFASLRHSSISFFESDRSETTISRWARARTRAAKVGKGLSKNEKAQKLALRHWLEAVGKGLSKNEKAQKLALRHWLEAIDPRHRYGHNLHLYYDVWFETGSSQPFFYWLDVGDGKEVNLEKCPRTNLQRQCIRYLGPKEREAYEVIVESEKLVYKQSGMLVDTDDGTKWIFVLSTTRNLYIGKKKKGQFQHSSFLAGGATTAAGRLVAHNGVLEAIWPYSGHYHPTEENFLEFISFLEEHHVNLTNVKKCAIDDDDPTMKVTDKELKLESTRGSSTNIKSSYTESVDVDVPNKEAANVTICHDEIGTNVKAPAFKLAKCLSRKWSSGAGPRIGCVREYSAQLQFQALEHVNLSPRTMPGYFPSNAPIPSPRPSPKIHLSPSLSCMGLPNPTVHASTSD
nr:iq domain-containing protein iqm1 [Quercus suber]